MSSNGPARLAETCETRDVSPSPNLDRGQQGECKPSSRHRVASREIAVREHSASCADDSVENLALRVRMYDPVYYRLGLWTLSGEHRVQKHGVLWQEKSGAQNEHRACFLFVEQRSMTSKERPKHSSASMGASGFASRPVVEPLQRMMEVT